MLDKKVVELLNDQIAKEFYSAYLYLDFANFYADAGLDGFCNWFRIQAQEEYVTSLINNIYGAAYDVKDFRTMQFLDWFIKEQGEEETNANDNITKMELFGSDPKSLYALNSEMAARVYNPPSLVL